MRSKNKSINKIVFSKNSRLGWFVGIAIFTAACSTPEVSHKGVDEVDSTILKLLISNPGHTVFSQQATVKFGQSQHNDTVSVNGIIIPDERRTNIIAARFGGRIERLYVRFPFQYVKKGEKLLELYSPELNTSISEYLFLLEKDKSSSLTAQARKRLELLGLFDSQIREFEKNGNAPSSVSIYSAYEGFVITSSSNMPSNQSTQEKPTSGMSGMKSPDKNNAGEANSTSTLIREGSYISAGQTLFAINDAREVIALLSIEPGLQALMKKGMIVNVESELLPGNKLKGTIDLVEPVLQKGQRFLFARATMLNANGLLKFNSLVKAEIDFPIQQSYSLPSSCVFDLGKRKIVWVKTQRIDDVSVFIPRIVVVGNHDGAHAEILSGLKPGEEVALDAGLLVDREGLIQTELP